LAWSEIVRRGHETQVPATRVLQTVISRDVQNKSTVLFEAEGCSRQRKANQAARILKRALHPKTVLFEFNFQELEKEYAYDLITKEVDEAVGAP
jgi:hypothetical protein